MPTTVTGNVKDLSGTSNTSGISVSLSLKWAGGGTPRVNGTALLATAGASATDRVVFPLAINSSTGAITGSVYSTRDAAGTGNGEIEVGGSLIAVWYEVQVSKGGLKIFSFPVHAKNGATLDLTSATPISTDPVVAAPTGDSTYARLDGGNTPFSGLIQFVQGLIAGAGKLLAWGSVGTTSVDTGISRTAAKTLAIGNGTQGDASGNLSLASLTATSASPFAALSGATGTNLTANLGRATSEVNLAVPSANGFFFTNADLAGGDFVVRQVTAARKIYLGTGTSAASVAVTNTGINLYTTLGTLPASIANDGGGGVVLTSNGAKQFVLANTGIFLTPGLQLVFQGATSGSTSLVSQSTASGALTLPAATDTLVGKATTDTLTNKTLTGATTGNNVSVLNAQGATTAITGTAADAVIYTYSLPANVIDTTSKGIRISCAANHSSGTANPSVKININGVNVITGSIGTAAGQSVNFEALILRTSTTAGGSKGMNTSGNALLPFSITLAGLAWTSAQIITFTFNVAATDQMTGIMFMVEQIQ